MLKSISYDQISHNLILEILKDENMLIYRDIFIDGIKSKINALALSQMHAPNRKNLDD